MPCQPQSTEIRSIVATRLVHPRASKENTGVQAAVYKDNVLSMNYL